MGLKELLTKVKKTVSPETWCCAYRFNDGNESLLTDSKKPFRTLPNTKELWCADPFVIEKDGTYYAFFEALDLMKRKGVIAFRTLDESSCGEINVIYEAQEHLSFPFIYEDKGELYIVPESAHSGCVFRLKCVDFPYKWEKDATLINGSFVDTVVLNSNDKRYYITQKTDDSNVFERVDLFCEEAGEVKEASGNPQKLDPSNSRGAGAVFSYEGRLIRPAQDCSASYGEKLNFNEITEISPDGFKETLFKTVTVSDVPVEGNNDFCGIHTYNKYKNVEIIDLKIPPRFNLRNTLGAVKKVFRRVLS